MRPALHGLRKKLKPSPACGIDIAQIYESGQVDGHAVLCMEYVAGGSLSDRLQARPLPPRQLQKSAVLLAGDQHAHEQNVLIGF